MVFPSDLIAAVTDPVTPEDLRVEQTPADDDWINVREVGKLDYVIHQYRLRQGPPDIELGLFGHWSADESKSLEFLLDRLVDLDKRCEELRTMDPTPINSQAWRWNRKRAARRFRRYVREKEIRVLEIPQSIHSLVERVLADESHGRVEHDVDWWLDKLWGHGAISDLEDYERRRQERPIIVVTGLDDAVASLLREADEAYFHGLFRATVALCRAVLEDVVSRVVEVQDIKPIRNDFVLLIDCITPRLWSSKAREIAHTVRDAGNLAMHSSDARFTEDGAWRVLVRTTTLIQMLINGGGLQKDRDA